MKGVLGKLLTRGCLAVLFVVNVGQGATAAAVPFERFTSEVLALRQAIAFQVGIVRTHDQGSDAWLFELVRLRAIVEDGIETLEAFGSEDCYRWYAETAILSLGIYREVVQADIDGETVSLRVRATQGTLVAIDSMQPIVRERCALIVAPLTTQEPALIQQRPLV